MGKYKRNIAGNLMKSIKSNDGIISRHITTTSSQYAKRINNILKKFQKMKGSKHLLKKYMQKIQMKLK